MLSSGAEHDVVYFGIDHGSAPPSEMTLPRIPDEFLDCAIYLYPDPKSANAGVQSGGSGFLVSLPDEKEPGKYITVAVTNRHVVETGSPVIRMNTKAGGVHIYDIPETAWTMHQGDQDLAAIPIPISPDLLKFRRISFAAIMDKAMAEQWDLGPGTDTFLVGRFIKRDGGQTNIPTVRFGNVSQMPSLVADEYKRQQESFMVETRSIAGFSGSPVFAHILPFAWRPKTQTIEDGYWGPALLGVNWGHDTQREIVRDVAGCPNQHGTHVRANLGMAFVIPGWRLIELLGQPDFKADVDALRKQFGAASA